MPQAATIKSLPHAFRMMTAMQAQGIEWGEDYRRAAAAALKDVLEVRMAAGIDRHLEAMDRLGEADRRNGSYRRWLMTELGEIELGVPRTRSWQAIYPRAVACLRDDLDDLAHLLPLQHPRRAQGGQNHERHRTQIPRGPAAYQTHGRLPGPDLNGPHPVRRLHPRKRNPVRGPALFSLTQTF